MATGQMLPNGHVSMDERGALRSVFDEARDDGWALGVVTTSSVVDATPAAFTAHAQSRSDRGPIGRELLARTHPEILFGGAGVALLDAERAGYRVVTDAATLAEACSRESRPLAALFTPLLLPFARPSLPTLAQLTSCALERLERAPRGFLLLVEDERIDEASHANNGETLLAAMAAFDDSVAVVLSWAAAHPDVLVLVSGDHECGGLTVVEETTSEGVPELRWSTTGHSTRPIRLYASGRGAELARDVHRLVDLHSLLCASLPDGHCDAQP